MDEGDDDKATERQNAWDELQQETRPEIGSPQSPDFRRFEAARLSMDSPDAQVATAGPVVGGRVAKPATISRNRLYPVLREAAVTGIVDDERIAQVMTALPR
ncbi:hypothetical protein ACLOAV_006795 [Pseudogymnoascus australis]